MSPLQCVIVTMFIVHIYHYVLSSLQIEYSGNFTTVKWRPYLYSYLYILSIMKEGDSVNGTFLPLHSVYIKL